MNIVDKIDNLVLIQNVIVSVYDKSALDQFIPGLLSINPDIKFYSTGGTYQHINNILGSNAQKHLIAISDYTGQPEIQGGLVKTLDFKIYLGLLSETYNQAHVKDISRVQGINFDMVVGNLYPFLTTISSPDVTVEKARANIDIGGPCMIRASAKNYLRVAVVTDIQDYSMILEKLENNNSKLDLNTRFTLAKKAFYHTAQYDKTISEYLNNIEFNEVNKCYRFIKGEE